jgi:hypothetical protein
VLVEFSLAEIKAEMAERNAAGAFGWLANLQADARDKAQRTTDPELARRHRQVFWHLRGELKRRAAK